MKRSAATSQSRMRARAGWIVTVLALAAGLEAVLEQRTHRRVVVFRPLYAVGGQDLGYLPGTADEKMEPWAAGAFVASGPALGEDRPHAEQVISVLENATLVLILDHPQRHSYSMIEYCPSVTAEK